jgi:N utilization substance protein A
MSKELFYLIDQIAREKGVSKDVLIEALSTALLSAAKKKLEGRENLKVEVDEKTFEIKLFEIKAVVDEVEDANLEVALEEAREIDDTLVPGDEIYYPLEMQDFGRIAAQTAKQVIFQRVREAEREVIFNEYKDKVGRVVTGTMMRKEKSAYFINIGKTDAILYQRDSLPGENLKRGEIVKAIIEEIRSTSKGPAIIVSRTNNNFVGELFKMEVPEIAAGLVIIKDIVREPGERTKIAVYSTNTSVDPVGACVGMKGTRVQSIVRELRGERIDIIPWTEDLRMLIARALSPASIERVGIVEDEKSAMVVVDDQNLSIAIGKKGQNVRLAMKLTGWDIDIMSETDYSKIKMEEAESAFAEATGETEPSAEDGSGPSAEETAPPVEEEPETSAEESAESEEEGPKTPNETPET